MLQLAPCLPQPVPSALCPWVKLLWLGTDKGSECGTLWKLLGEYHLTGGCPGDCCQWILSVSPPSAHRREDALHSLLTDQKAWDTVHSPGIRKGWIQQVSVILRLEGAYWGTQRWRWWILLMWASRSGSVHSHPGAQGSPQRLLGAVSELYLDSLFLMGWCSGWMKGMQIFSKVPRRSHLCLWRRGKDGNLGLHGWSVWGCVQYVERLVDNCFLFC